MADSRFYRVPGMAHPYWATSEAHDWPNPGDLTLIAFNRDADTDMGNLYGPEFHAMFPNAVEISKEEWETGRIEAAERRQDARSLECRVEILERQLKELQGKMAWMATHRHDVTLGAEATTGPR